MKKKQHIHRTVMLCFSSHGDKLKLKLLRRRNLTATKNMNTFVGSSQSSMISADNTIQGNSPIRSRLFDRERLNLESHQLVWCDNHVHDGLNGDLTISKLREIVDYTKFFDNQDSCKHYLQESQYVVCFLVCSDNIGKQLIPEIHHLQNIRSIFVYSQNSEHLQSWPSSYTKVKKVYTNHKSLLQAVDSDVKRYLEKEKDGVFGNFDKQDRTTESGSASWWVIFMDALCHLPYPREVCHQRLTTELRNYYDGKVGELRVIDEFEREYTPDKAVWWYTRDTFFFRLINKANRQYNVRVMFAFGYYIKDLFLQLKKEHETFKTTNVDNVQVQVFRGQIMSEDEVETLKSAYMVRLTSFLSTSLDRRLSLSFLPPISSVMEGYVRVLLEINLNARYNSKPFGDISHLSEFSNEKEILLMMGTFLRLRSSSYSEDEKIIKVMLTLEDDYILPFENRKISLKECVSIIAGKVCKDAPEEEINTIFDELNELFTSEGEQLEAERYRALGGYQEGYGRENYKAALTYYKQALTIWQRYPENNGFEIANLHLKIGRLHYFHFEDDKSAQEQYDAAILICKTTLNQLPDNERQKAVLYQILSTVYLEKEEINDKKEDKKSALHYEQLRLQALLKFCSPIDRQLGKCYKNIAELQEEMEIFDEALINYKEICKIYVAQNNHEDLSRIYQRISNIYKDNLKDLSSALKYRLLKHHATVQSNEILPFHDLQEIEDKKNIVIQSHIQLADLQLGLRDFEAARINLTAAKKLYEDMNWEKQAKEIDEQLANINRLEQDSK
ncbi:hypothetical protein I4U23_015597 [Adineta vaga]|nr:hypothetical protein I4U23_015597 [Adineta vaga]